MISPQRAASLGLTVPLTAIFIALLGLWPLEDEEEPLPDYRPPISEGGGGGRSRAQADAQRSKRIFLAKQRSILEHNLAIIAMTIAIAEEEALL